MQSFRDPGLLIGRVLLSLVFLATGFGKIMSGGAGIDKYMGAKGVPFILFWPSTLVEFLGAVLVIVGWKTSWAALALGVFAILAGVLFHGDLGNMTERTTLLKDLGLAGGLLIIAVVGAGRYSIDGRTGG